MSPTIRSLVIPVSDLDAAKAVYTALFGDRTPTSRRVRPNASPRVKWPRGPGVHPRRRR